ncbi:MAG TPA: glycosyltransferase family 87 protein [Nitrospira sp.]|nr:glycosyltransferase family 87 protein [Nitrospira sp.]
MTDQASNSSPRTESVRLSLRPTLASVCVLAAVAYGYILAFHRSFAFRDFDIHREVGRRFLSGDYLYANDFCYAYLPVAAMYFSPLALMERSAGLMFRYGLAVGCLVATIVLFNRMVIPSSDQEWRQAYLVGGGAILLTFQFVLQDLDDGGPHLILLGILSSAIYSVWRNRPRLGALLFGLGIALKVTPALFLLLFLWKRQWRLFAHTILATALWIILPMSWMGPTSWWTHHVEWTRNAVLSALDQQLDNRQLNEQRIRNQALKPTLLRYLVTYPADHPMRQGDPAYVPILDVPPTVANLGVIAAALGLLAVLAWTSQRSFEPESDQAWARDCAGIFVLALLLSPMTWQQHLAWLLPGAIVILAAVRSGSGMTKMEWLGLAGYVLLAMVLNYEILGKARFEMFLSYHPFGIAMILLFGLIVGLNSENRRSLSGSLRSTQLKAALWPNAQS